MATKEKDGSTTSSPPCTPQTTSARWSPVVQLETATACPACCRWANASSNSATRGPWATQPDAMTAASAWASS